MAHMNASNFLRFALISDVQYGVLCFCLSQLLHACLSRYNKLSQYMFHHCVNDMLTFVYRIRKIFCVYIILHISENQIIENFHVHKISVIIYIFRVIALNTSL